MNRINYLIFLVVLSLGQNSLPANNLLPGSGIKAETGDIPSAWWPQFVKTTEALEVLKDDSSKVLVKPNTRGVLLRVEGEHLLVDFGRKGIRSVLPKSTDFYDQVQAFMSGEATKEFPNFALQIGNKLMTFGRGKKSGPIRFDDVKGTELYILLYLDDYSPEFAQDLWDFGLAYKDLQKDWPQIEVVLMPRDRKFYDFGATVGYPVPFIAPHMRIGYIDSLQHKVEPGPGFVAVDPNGRILARSENPLVWSELADALGELVNQVGVEWQAPRISHRKAHQRTSSWNN